MLKCPKCGSFETDAYIPRTVYLCGSSDYDQREGTFQQSEICKLRVEKSNLKEYILKARNLFSCLKNSSRTKRNTDMAETGERMLNIILEDKDD